MKKRLKGSFLVKQTRFRMWKSGKNWLYASSFVLVLAGGVRVGLCNENVVLADSNNQSSASMEQTMPTSQAATPPQRSASIVNNLANLSSASSNIAEPSQVQDVKVLASGYDGTGPVTDAGANPSTNLSIDKSSSVSEVSGASNSAVSTKAQASNNIDGEGKPWVSLSSNGYSPWSQEPSNPAETNKAVNLSDRKGVDDSQAAKPAQSVGILSQVVNDMSIETLQSVSASQASAPDLNVLFGKVDQAYNTTIGQALDELLQGDMTEKLNQLILLTGQVKNMFGQTPIANMIFPIAESVLNSAKEAVKVAQIFGLNPRTLVLDSLKAGVNTIGKTIQAFVVPTLKGVPVVGPGLATVIDPIFNNITAISPAFVISSLSHSFGISDLLSTVSSMGMNVVHVGINTLQGVLNITTAVVSKLKSVVDGVSQLTGVTFATFSNVLKSITTPIQWVIDQIKGLLNEKNNDHSSVTHLPSINIDGGEQQHISTQEASLKTLDIMIYQNETWTPQQNFISATDSSGNNIPLDKINITGMVTSTIPGTYYIRFSFKDAGTGSQISQSATVMVLVNDGQHLYSQPSVEDNLNGLSSGKARLETVEVSIPVFDMWRQGASFKDAVDSKGNKVGLKDIQISGSVDISTAGTYLVRLSFKDTSTATIISKMAEVKVVSENASDSNSDSSSSLSESSSSTVSSQESTGTSLADTKMISVSPTSASNLTSFFPSTTDYPSTKTVYLPDDPNFKPDENEISKYFLQYVNELRTLNGQTTLTISTSDTARAQQRARAIVDSFNHETVSSATENIGTNAGITDQMHSNQEIAYYMVMAWYDETDNPEPLGDGHYGHRANLLYGGPTMGLSFYRPSARTAEFTDYYAFESPIYTDFSLYLKAKSMANAMTNPVSVPLPNITFVYVNAATLATLRTYLNWSQLGHADPKVENNAKPSLSLA